MDQPANSILVGKSDIPVYLQARYSNRHGLIAGATGTGKTVSLQVLAEGFSKLGVPVFVADVKGDLAGLSQGGGGNPKIDERASALGLAPLEHKASPVIFWDLFAEQGTRVRTTISEMGPLLLSRLLALSEAQEGVLTAAFKYADDNGMLLLDLKDLQALLGFMAENQGELRAHYGNVNTSSVGAIQRSLLMLEEQGAEAFFGEPALEIADLMRFSPDGRGYINVLAADRLMQSPRLYATFLLWMLSELFEDLPEVGDPEKPRLVFFFDEAHLLFTDAPPALVEKIEQVVRLIRSKGVGVFFVTQNPIDIPDTVLSQLSNRIQHALRAFTPREQKAVKGAAETFRPNPAFDTSSAITELAVGEALVSVLEEKGTPCVVQRTLISPPVSRVGAISLPERQQVITTSPVAVMYDREVDRDSAYEMLKVRAEQQEAEKQQELQAREQEKLQREQDKLQREEEKQRTARAKANPATSALNAAMMSAARSIGTRLAGEILRGMLGGRRR